MAIVGISHCIGSIWSWPSCTAAGPFFIAQCQLVVILRGHFWEHCLSKVKTPHVSGEFPVKIMNFQNLLASTQSVLPTGDWAAQDCMLIEAEWGWQCFFTGPTEPYPLVYFRRIGWWDEFADGTAWPKSKLQTFFGALRMPCLSCWNPKS